MDPISTQTTATSEPSLILSPEISSSALDDRQFESKIKIGLFGNCCMPEKVKSKQLTDRRANVKDINNIFAEKNKCTKKEQVRNYLRKTIAELEEDQDKELMITMIRLFKFWLNDDKTINRAIENLDSKNLKLNDDNLSKFFGRLSFSLQPLDQ